MIKTIATTTYAANVNTKILQCNFASAHATTEKLIPLKYRGSVSAAGRGPTAQKLSQEDLKELNRLCSENKWHVLNNNPRPFLWLKSSRDSKIAWDIHRKLGYEHRPIIEMRLFPFLNSIAWRVQVIWLIRLIFVGVIMLGIPFLYQYVVPEEYRSKYKFYGGYDGTH